MGDALDSELSSLITKLNQFQRDMVGTESPLSNIEKGGAGLDKFTELKNKINLRLSSARTLINDIQKMDQSQGKNSRDLISQQSKIRSEIAKMGEEWQELDATYRNEIRKRRSKLSSQELAERQEVVLMYQNQIEDIKISQRMGFLKGRNQTAPRVGTMAESGMFVPKGMNSGTEAHNGSGSIGGGGGGGYKEAMTDEQMHSLVAIKARDNRIDKEIEKIGEGVDELKHLARDMQDEINMQVKTIDRIQDKVVYTICILYIHYTHH